MFSWKKSLIFWGKLKIPSTIIAIETLWTFRHYSDIATKVEIPKLYSYGFLQMYVFCMKIFYEGINISLLSIRYENVEPRVDNVLE